MPVKKEPWPEGTPAWVDVMVPDVEVAKTFYSGLFGWEFDQTSEEFNSYVTARIGDDAVAGLGPSEGPEAPPPAWTTYLAVDSAGAVADKIAEAGGNVFVPAMEVGSFGSMAIASDPTGSVFGIWQSGEHTGVDRYNEPGALCWNEAMVGDYQAGLDFYAKVFGFTYSDLEGDVDYSLLEVDGATVGGLGTAASIEAGVPPHWRTYFSVADAEAACRQAEVLGGRVIHGPEETGPFGLMATIAGPTGEVFLVNQPPADPSGAGPE